MRFVTRLTAFSAQPLRRYRSLILPALLLSVGYYAADATANETGITRVTRKNGTGGCSCHAKSAATTVSWSANDTTVAPGSKLSLTLTVAHASQVAAGCDIAASEGTLAPGTNSGLKLQLGELTHVSPKPMTNHQAKFNFDYTVPSAPGVYTLYANGNAVNGNHSEGDDAWNFAPNLKVTVSEGSAVARTESAMSVMLLPNPASTKSELTLTLTKSGQTSVELFDAAGHLVRQLENRVANAGPLSVSLETAALTNGSYFVRVMTGGALVAERRLVVQH